MVLVCTYAARQFDVPTGRVPFTSSIYTRYTPVQAGASLETLLVGPSISL